MLKSLSPQVIKYAGVEIVRYQAPIARNNHHGWSLKLWMYMNYRDASWVMFTIIRPSSSLALQACLGPSPTGTTAIESFFVTFCFFLYFWVARGQRRDYPSVFVFMTSSYILAHGRFRTLDLCDTTLLSNKTYRIHDQNIWIDKL